MDDTTAQDGSIDAIAASLLEGGAQKEDEKREEDIEQPQEGDAENDVEEAQGDEEAADKTDEDESEGEADAAEEEQAEQLYTVKVDGREQQVPLSELLRGYSGQSYIQRGMQEAATAKREAEALYSTLQNEREQLVQFFQAAQTGQLPMQPPEPPSEDLLSKDPIGFLEARVKYDKDLAAFQNAQTQAQQYRAQAEQDAQRQRAAFLAEQHERLVQEIPAFAKPETAAKLKQDLLATGQNYGFTAEELMAVDDARMVKVLYEAAQYRRILSGKPVEKQVAQTSKTPVIKPGAKMAANAGKRMTQEKAQIQMKRSGSVDDVARFLIT